MQRCYVPYVRSALITLAAGACVSLLMPQMPAYQLLSSAPAWTAVLWFLATWLQFLLVNVLTPMLIFAGAAMAAHATVRAVTRRTEHRSV